MKMNLLKIVKEEGNTGKGYMERMKRRFEELHPNIRNTPAQCCRDNTAQLAGDKEKVNLRDLQEEYLE